MATYHLYFLRQGMIVGADDIEAEDDQEAARLAGERGEGRTVELWNTHSRLGIIEPAAQLTF